MGPGAGGGGGQPPDLEEMLKRGQDKVKQVMHGGGIPGPLLFLVAVVACAVIAWQAFTFRVNPDELGVVMRFGKFVEKYPPGPAFPPALSDRRGAPAEGDAPEHHRGRHALGRRRASTAACAISAPRA